VEGHFNVGKVKVTLLLAVGQSVSQSVSLGVEPARYLLLFDSHGLAFVGRPLRREDGSVFCMKHQRSLSRGRVPWDSQPCFTVSDLRLPFPLPLTTRRVTVEVFDPASTRDCSISLTFAGHVFMLLG
jgi:hypothetical protein